MDIIAINNKFGDSYVADENTFTMGIDRRITRKISERFSGRTVFETCTGAGFSTISLAEAAESVITIEIDKNNQKQSKENVRIAGLEKKVRFVLGDCLDDSILETLENIDSAFLDPDWAVTGPDHVYRFKNSNTKPPADLLLQRVLGVTPNIALILPPYIDKGELLGLPHHEQQTIYLEGELALFCLYFGDLIREVGETILKVE